MLLSRFGVTGSTTISKIVSRGSSPLTYVLKAKQGG